MKWQPTPVLLPGKFHGQRRLVSYSPWDRKESDTTEQLQWLTLERKKAVWAKSEKRHHHSLFGWRSEHETEIFLAMPCSMWDLSSPNKDQTQDLHWKCSLNHWTTGETCRVLTAGPSGKSCEAEYHALFRMLGWAQLGVLNIWLWRLKLIRCTCVLSHFHRVWLFATPMDCSPLGSLVHGIFQTRILEWVAISFSRGSSRPRDRTDVSSVSCTGRRVLYY